MFSDQRPAPGSRRRQGGAKVYAAINARSRQGVIGLKRNGVERFFTEFVTRTVSDSDVDPVNALAEQFGAWKEQCA